MDLSRVVFQTKASCQIICKEVSHWLQYTVRWIDKASSYLQNSLRASFVLVGMNIIFFKLALRISRLAHRIFNAFIPLDKTSLRERKVRKMIFVGMFFFILGAANCLFCKMVRIPLASWKVAGISVITTIACIIWETND